MFSSITTALKSTYQHMRSALSSVFSSRTIDSETLNELERTLLKADTGTKTTRVLIDTIKKQWQNGTINSGEDIRTALRHELQQLLPMDMASAHHADVYILIGINGGGKTSTTAKLAHYFAQQNKSVLIAGTDTFRAAASEQLAAWADKQAIASYIGAHGQDPAAVAYQACQEYQQTAHDTLIIDTAGRLQTNQNLMHELAKIQRVVKKKLPQASIATLLVLDSMLGQNGIDQAVTFQQYVPIDGLIVTKMDGTGKGGALFAISKALHIPITYITYGEQIKHIAPFDRDHFVDQLLS